ncbi:protein SEY1, putative [Hepatocystis sp. ex Piliocolobus tephrosceles]|nr:protein SEY1, putative [Hepatocystis sp. ex Piliocolobus tephrosceles]
MDDLKKIQIIDYEGNMIKDLKEWVHHHGLSDLGFNYNVIAILGSQSSGKSTLLNNLFHTSFDVMNTKMGHRQTTQGLWLSYDNCDDAKISDKNDSNSKKSENNLIKKKPTLIIDVEGNDSKERGENRLTFEHRSSLFSLALADCVIVNLWYHSLGNFTASNYGLLKTVMEVDLELFQNETHSAKTILLFVVRDWFEEFASIDVVRHKILDEYIYKIWSEMKKPANLDKSIDVNKYFIIEVVGLSHGIIKKEEFLKDVKKLRNKWINELRPDIYSRNIPADGFPQYCYNIWETIVKQSQLDIPSQKEMLATFRCQEIKNNVLNNINLTIKEKLHSLQNKPIHGFKTWAEKEIIEKGVDEYLLDACRYKENICKKTLEELLEHIYMQLQVIVDSNLNYLQKVLSTKFSKILNGMYDICLTDKSSFSFAVEPSINQLKEYNKRCSITNKESGSGITTSRSNISDNIKNDSSNKKQELQFEEEEEKKKNKKYEELDEEDDKQHKCITLWSNFLYNADKLEYEILNDFFKYYEQCNVYIKHSNKIHEFNYKPSLRVLSTSMYKDTNRIRNVQCNLLLNKTKGAIKNEFKNIDYLLINTKNAEDYWDHILNLVKRLQNNIFLNLSKCFINLKEDSTYEVLLKNNNYEYIYDDDDDQKKEKNVWETKDNHSSSNRDKKVENVKQYNYHNDNNDNNTKINKIELIRKKIKYNSIVNDEINKILNEDSYIYELNNFYLDKIMDVLKNKFIEISDELPNIIVKRFESVFNYDDAEQPRQWKDTSMSELKQIFRESKTYAFLIIDILQKNINVEIIDDYVSGHLLKEEVIERAKNKAKRKIQDICRDAQYIQETGGKMSLKNVPFFFWVILLILGWNEILLIVRIFFKLNVIIPLFITFILIIGTFFYNGNIQILNYIQKIIFYLLKNSYSVYKQIQTISHAATTKQHSFD